MLSFIRRIGPAFLLGSAIFGTDLSVTRAQAPTQAGGQNPPAAPSSRMAPAQNQNPRANRPRPRAHPFFRVAPVFILPSGMSGVTQGNSAGLRGGFGYPNPMTAASY